MLVVAALAVFSVASAQDCPDVDLDDWRDALAATDAAFEAAQLPKVRAILEGTAKVLPCLKVVVPTDLIGRYARQQAFLRMVDQDGVEATSWFQLARAADPQGSWPPYVPGRHTARDLSREPAPTQGQVEGLGLVVPEGGGVFLDGRYLVSPTAEAEVPHLLQVANGSGEVTFAAWQQGSVFPDVVLGPPAAVPPAPLWFTDPVDPAVARAERRHNRYLAAGGLGAMAVGLFGGALLARQTYDGHPTDGLRVLVNGATIGSGAAATGALVVGTIGLVGK